MAEQFEDDQPQSPPAGRAPGVFEGSAAAWDRPPPGDPPPAGPPPAFPARSGRSTARIIGVVAGAVVLLVLLAGVGAFFYLRSTATIAEARVDQCLGGDDIERTAENPKLTVVDCASGEARYRIVGKVADKTATDAQRDETLCAPFLDRAATFSYWQESSVGSGRGPVFCLASAR